MSCAAQTERTQLSRLIQRSRAGTLRRYAVLPETVGQRPGRSIWGWFMGLFDDPERTHRGRADYTEDGFSFLNRSAQPAAQRVREVLGKWFEQYPASEQDALRVRFREEFEPAFYELFLHAHLIHHPADVEVHPAVFRGSRKLPDFLVRFSGGEQVLVEAVVSSDQTRMAKARDARENVLFEEIEKLHSPDFWLYPRKVTNPHGTQPSGRRIRAFLKRELAKLSPDQVRQDIDRSATRALPTLLYRDGATEISFAVIPKGPRARGRQDSNTIGVFPPRTRWGGSSSALASCVRRKTTRYGQLTCPYVVAVNSLSRWGTEHDDIMTALWGSEDFPTGVEAAKRRGPERREGALLGPNEPQNTRVSGVMVGSVVPWNIGRAELTLYHNPFASRPCLDVPWRVAQIIPSEGKCERIPGETAGHILGLPTDWPGELFPRD